MIKFQLLKSTFGLRIGRLAFPLECYELLAAPFANSFDETRIRMADEILERCLFPILITHEEQGHEGRKQHHCGSQFDRLKRYELAKPFTHHPVADLIVILRID